MSKAYACDEDLFSLHTYAFEVVGSVYIYTPELLCVASGFGKGCGGPTEI